MGVFDMRNLHVVVVLIFFSISLQTPIEEVYNTVAYIQQQNKDAFDILVQ